jgi:hypothetical protein
MSKALTTWRGQRSVRLDKLAAAHVAVRAAATGVHSEYLNWSLLLALASEFHGFARDLHDLAVDAFVMCAASTNAPLADVLRSRLADGRMLSRGNPHPDALADDFGRLGLALWPTLGTAAAGWRASLTTAMTARNAVAHADNAGLRKVRAQGAGLSVKTITGWRRDLDALAGAMDAAVAKHHAALFSTARPW